MQLRPYQKEAIAAIQKHFNDGELRTLLVMATGCGKTVVFTSIAQSVVKKGGRVLILAHREELLMQAQDKLQKFWGIHGAIEKAEQTAVGTDASVVIASIQTICLDARLKSYPGGTFDLIIIDEAHHSVSRTYQKVLSHFGHTKVLGVTATPERADKKYLAEIYSSIAYEYPLLQAIHDGYLVDIEVKTIPLKLDISNVKETAGDYQLGDLGDALRPYLTQIADTMAVECRKKRTVAFLPIVELAKEFSEMLNLRGFRAAEIDCQSENRKELLQDFHEGKYDVICNAMILTEGFDEPSIDCIIILRPTKSRSLYQQMVGRGTRLAKNKKELLLLDFLWLTKKHDLCRPAHLIAPTEEIAQKMTKNIIHLSESGASMNLEKLLLKAMQESAEKEDGERYFLYDLSTKLENTEIYDYQPSFKWEKEKPTERQLNMLTRNKIDKAQITSKGLASVIIGSIIKRREQNKSSLKQIIYLSKKGFQKVETWSFQDASFIMDLLARNHWNVPEWMDSKTFHPKMLKDLKR